METTGEEEEKREQKIKRVALIASKCPLVLIRPHR